MMTKRNAKVIKGKIGRLIEVEDPRLMARGERGFLRIRVGVKWGKPLIDGFGCQKRRGQGCGHLLDMKNYQTFILPMENWVICGRAVIEKWRCVVIIHIDKGMELT